MHLPDPQKIRGVSVWPGPELPRTEGTRKLKRRDIARLGGDRRGADAHSGSGASVEALLAQYAGGRASAPGRPWTSSGSHRSNAWN